MTVDDTGEVTAAIRVSYAFRPVVLRDDAGEIHARVVEHQLTGDAVVSFGIAHRLALGVDLPHVLFQAGDDLSRDALATAVVGARPVPTFALGDPGLRAKVALVIPDADEHGVEQGFGLGADERFTLPLGDEASFLGEGNVTSETRVLADLGLGPITLHADLGVKLRGDTGAYACALDAPEDDCLSRFGHELPFGLAVAFHPSALGLDDGGRVTLFAETRGHLPLSPIVPFDSALPSAWFASVAGRFRFGDVALLTAVELGLNDGVGVAPFGATFGVSYAPRSKDTDRDGVADEDDRCPTFAEDRDGFEDADGCPEMDNDGDGVPDPLDLCPSDPAAEKSTRVGCPS
ncbi:MAG TPA: thrombospondin type 3 repeat-containing protein [Polyangiaceae bacterium]|nr:thrombospondin type 3 repeat-containing protein [Polyangiaceae bacterium]